MTQPLKYSSSLELKAFIQSAPNIVLLLEPDFTIVAVSDPLLKATMMSREDIIGKQLFDVYPDNPHDPTADGETNLRASLERVLKTGSPENMAIREVRRSPPARRRRRVRGASLEADELPGAGLCRPGHAHRSPVRGSYRARPVYADVTPSMRPNLAEANSLYKAIYDQGIFSGRVDLDGRVTDVNESALVQCG